VFAASSFYWAVGGTVGVETVGNELERRAEAREAGLVAELWAAAGLKVLAGLLALALVRPWGRALPRRLLGIAAWATGALLTLYGAANLVQHGLMEIGWADIPEGLGANAVRWHLALWDPFWLAGGLLFLAAAWAYSRNSA
jgi:hypothetical protein